MQLCIFLLLCSTTVGVAIKRYTIDLDVEPENRWNEVIRDHLQYIPAIAEESKSYIPSKLQPFVWWLAARIGNLFSEEYERELKGIAREANLPLGEVVGLNILYDITAFDRKHILSGLGCTSIVAQDKDGKIIHGRNLDYEMGSLLKNITVLVDFTRNGKIVYAGTTFALYNGLLTGQRPSAFTVSLNARYSGAYIDNILMELYTRFKRPVSYLIREGALTRFTSTPLISPSYIILGGMSNYEGVVISRNRMKAFDIYTLSKDRWYLVETNFDHWKKDGDKRRTTAQAALDKVGRSNLHSQYLQNILLLEPVRNNLTIYSTVLSASSPSNFYDSFQIIN
ncbi:unnamed protein product [Auanema sp. JU1783]|nr:unnamed protein product [Auanema sp. JU1783]